ncbi:hypothetical protein BGX27_010929, partial [Mortierella sp. AM989]
IAKSAVVIGGRLVRLEIAKATLDLGIKTTIYERNAQVLARQLGSEGAVVVLREIVKRGIKILCDKKYNYPPHGGIKYHVDQISKKITE